MMRTTKQAQREAKQLFGMCLVNGHIDADRVLKVVRATIQFRRRGYLSVLRRFQRLVKLEMARHTAEIESATSLPAELQAEIRTGLEGLYGSGLTTLFDLNPGLIGGMRIKVGNDVFDGSVQCRLAALAKSFGITRTNGREARF
jgi:F-type H+-transporting ATPase subunit delta